MRIEDKANQRPSAPALAKTADKSAAAPPQAAAGDAELIAQRVAAWAAAWSGGRFDSYSGFYAPSFVPADGASRADWIKQREARVSGRSGISVELKDIKVTRREPDAFVAEFIQRYRSAGYGDTTRKILRWVKVGSDWLIEGETARRQRKAGGKTDGASR